MQDTIIYLIRHAEAEGNLYRRIHGQYNSNVTENGRRQIAALRERFRDVPVDAVYSSDLTRTCETARAISEPKHLTVRRDPRFREIAIGCWEDVPFGELELTDAEQLRNFNENPRAWHTDGSESFAEFTGRFVEGLTDAIRENEGKSIAIFTHGGILARVLTVLFPGKPSGHSDNTAVTKLRWNGGYTLEYQNDNSHLSEEISTLARQNWWRKAPDNVDHNLWFSPFEGEIDWYLDLSDDEIPVAPMASLQFAMLGRKPVGLVQLDPEAGQAEGVGTVDYLGLDPKHRGKRLGVQLIGCAVSFYRNLGRDKIRICVPERYQSSLPFFEAYGFSPLQGGWIEKEIAVPAL